jgi:hypothetical protein
MRQILMNIVSSIGKHLFIFPNIEKLYISSQISSDNFAIQNWTDSFVFCSNSKEIKRGNNLSRRINEQDLDLNVMFGYNIISES